MRAQGNQAANQRRASGEGGLARAAEWRDAVGGSEHRARAAGETEGPNSLTITTVGGPPARPDANSAAAALASRKYARARGLASIRRDETNPQNFRCRMIDFLRRIRCGDDAVLMDFRLMWWNWAVVLL